MLAAVWLLIMSSSGGAGVWWVSVPEHHVLCLSCGPHPDLSQDYNWTHGLQEVLTQHQQDRDQDQDLDQDQDQNQDKWRFSLGSNGTLCVLSLRSSDSGLYHCNRHLRADLQVLTGQVFSVAAGRTLLLPCGSSSRPRQRWSWRRSQSRSKSRWEPVLTRSRGGAVVLERPDPRVGFEHGALRIAPLLPQDSGEYRCNGDPLGTVQVLQEPGPDLTSASPAPENTTVTPFVKITVLQMLVWTLGLTVLLSVVVGVVIFTLNCRRRRCKAKPSPESTELQLWISEQKTDESEEQIHYASLGRPTAWKPRPDLTTGGSEERGVIYSAVCT